MSTWEDDENDGDLEPFDPAKSAIDTTNPNNRLDTVCRYKFIDLYHSQFPKHMFDRKLFYDKYISVSNLYIVEHYVEHILRHYYSTDLPYEDDLETPDKVTFPTDKELKRFIKNEFYSINFDLIDRYAGSQPETEDAGKSPKLMQPYFLLLKSLVLEYYPQLEKLPARGFRELERSLYTITYLLWIDLTEAAERLKGVNKEYYDELDRKRKEKTDERLRKRKEKKEAEEKDDPVKLWENMTDDEKDEREKELEEIERLQEIEFDFRNRLYVKMANRFIELYPNYKLPYEDFLAKVKTECWITYRDTFYNVYDMLEHYKISDEPYKKDAYQYKSVAYEEYLKIKERGNQEEIDAFWENIEDWDRNWLKFDIDWHEMGKTMLKEFYEAFPQMINLSSAAMLEIKNQVFGTARFNLKELYGARDRTLKRGMEVHEEWDNKVETHLRKKYDEGEL